MRFRMVSILASLLTVGTPVAARATITVPNSGSGNCGTGPCFSITNTAGVGIQGVGATTGVYGSSDNAYGVVANVQGATGTGGLLAQVVSSSNTSGAAIVALGNNTLGVKAFSNTNAAVYAHVDPANAGTAIYGDAGGSSSALAGFFYGNVTVTGLVNGVTVGSSDARLKKDVNTEVGSLKVLQALRPVTYRWKDTTTVDGKRIQHGFIAQELQKVLPELVYENGRTGMLSVNYVAVVPLVVGAIQEQQRVISDQEARIAALENRLRSSTVSSKSGYTGLGIAVGLLPVGLVLGLRRRRPKKD